MNAFTSLLGSLFARKKARTPDAVLVRSLTRLARQWTVSPRRRIDATGSDRRSATERFLLFSLLPAWLVPGVVDYALR